MIKVRSFWKGFKKGSTEFSQGVAKIVNNVLLTFAYVIGVGLTVLIAKRKQKSFLDLSLDKEKSSYWEEYNLKTEPKESYYKQF